MGYLKVIARTVTLSINVSIILSFITILILAFFGSWEWLQTVDVVSDSVFVQFVYLAIVLIKIFLFKVFIPIFLTVFSTALVLRILVSILNKIIKSKKNY